jgi:hypothetical protein
MASAIDMIGWRMQAASAFGSGQNGDISKETTGP